MKKRTVFANSAMGFKHRQMALANEDAFALLDKDSYKIIAIADGHGARECFRSEIGSRLAVDVAIQNLEVFAQTIDKYALFPHLQNPEDQEQLVRSLIQDIVENWNQYIYADIQAFPIQEEEYMRAQTLSSIYQKGMYLTNIYGTTLLAALICESYILILQQGDGLCVQVDQQGNVSYPVPEDDLCIRNITTSLCDKDAIKRMRYVLIDRNEADLAALFLSSDGIEKSFNDTIHLSAFYAELCRELEELDDLNIEYYFDHLLPIISKRGSKDDVSIAGWIDQEQIENIDSKLAQYVQVAHNMDEMKRAEDQLHQEQNTKKHFHLECDKIDQRLQSLDQHINELKQEKEDLKKSLAAMEAKCSQQTIGCKKAEHALQEANGRYIRSLIALEEQKEEE